LDSPLTRNDGLLTASDNTLLLHILDGFADDRVTGVVVNKNASDALTVSDIRNVLAYVHVHFHYQTHAHAGQLIYNTTCVACHGEDGKGAIPGIPDLGEMDGVMTQSDTILLDHILNGFESRGSLMAMPARGANIDLTIADLQNVLDYLHQNFHYRTFNDD
jgi:cytochrome c5